MKSNKGVTLIILTVYIVIMMIVLSILSLVSDYFYSNTSYLTENGKYISEFNKFNMFFIEDVKNNSQLYSIKSTEIVFLDGTTYTYKESPDKGIYRNDVKICNNIEYCYFSSTTEDGTGIEKILITVEMAIESGMSFTTTNDYILKYW